MATAPPKRRQEDTPEEEPPATANEEAEEQRRQALTDEVFGTLELQDRVLMELDVVSAMRLTVAPPSSQFTPTLEYDVASAQLRGGRVGESRAIWQSLVNRLWRAHSMSSFDTFIELLDRDGMMPFPNANGKLDYRAAFYYYATQLDYRITRGTEVDFLVTQRTVPIFVLSIKSRKFSLQVYNLHRFWKEDVQRWYRPRWIHLTAAVGKQSVRVGFVIDTRRAIVAHGGPLSSHDITYGSLRWPPEHTVADTLQLDLNFSTYPRISAGQHDGLCERIPFVCIVPTQDVDKSRAFANVLHPFEDRTAGDMYEFSKIAPRELFGSLGHYHASLPHYPVPEWDRELYVDLLLTSELRAHENATMPTKRKVHTTDVSVRLAIHYYESKTGAIRGAPILMNTPPVPGGADDDIVALEFYVPVQEQDMADGRAVVAVLEHSRLYVTRHVQKRSQMYRNVHLSFGSAAFMPARPQVLPIVLLLGEMNPFLQLSSCSALDRSAARALYMPILANITKLKVRTFHPTSLGYSRPYIAIKSGETGIGANSMEREHLICANCTTPNPAFYSINESLGRGAPFCSTECSDALWSTMYKDGV